VERVRPKMMTVVAIMAGLLPIMWSTGTGSEIMQRIVVPMIGAMISSTLLTLIVIPAIFGLVKGFRLPSEHGSESQPPSESKPTKRHDACRHLMEVPCALVSYEFCRVRLFWINAFGVLNSRTALA
jgi:hypothetical protein